MCSHISSDTPQNYNPHFFFLPPPLQICHHASPEGAGAHLTPVCIATLHRRCPEQQVSEMNAAQTVLQFNFYFFIFYFFARMG